jgi:uncharacterized protein YdaU (DUF1376 family)
MRWYKRDPDAAISGMTGLTPEERGIYNTVIDYLYSRDGDLPTDDNFFARACECRPQVWRRVRDSLIAKGKLHYKTDGKLTANRVEKELQTARKLIANYHQSGVVSDENNNEIKATEPVRAREQPQPHPEQHPEKKEKTTSGGRSATRPARDEFFEEFWKAYPRRDGANPKEPARKVFVAAVKSGADPQEIIAGARACAARDREKIGTPYTPQAVKWLRDQRWRDYAPEAPGDASTGPPETRGWKPGMPTDEELRRKYANGGNSEGQAGLAGSSAQARAGEPVAFHHQPAGGTGRNTGGMEKLGGLFQASRLDADRHDAGP